MTNRITKIIEAAEAKSRALDLGDEEMEVAIEEGLSRSLALVQALADDGGLDSDLESAVTAAMTYALAFEQAGYDRIGQEAREVCVGALLRAA